jgi:hypothetical protein
MIPFFWDVKLYPWMRENVILYPEDKAIGSFETSELLAQLP